MSESRPGHQLLLTLALVTALIVVLMILAFVVGEGFGPLALERNEALLAALLLMIPLGHLIGLLRMAPAALRKGLMKVAR